VTPVFYDFETFFSAQHSLSKLNPIEYVMHPETELQSVSYAIGDGPIVTVVGPDAVAVHMLAIDWSDKIAVAHNGSGFDHLILVWRLRIKPKAFGCTLAMARPFYGVTVGCSLAKVAKEMGLPEKGSLDDVNTKGLKFAQFTPATIHKMEAYNDRDTALCRMIFNELGPKLGVSELRLIDMTIRMMVYPQFEADFDLLESALAEEKEKKRVALLDLAKVAAHEADPAWTEDQLLAAMRAIVMSQPRFALLLEQLGVAVPRKPSPTAKDADGLPKMIPALAKTDKGMIDLLEYEDEADPDRARRVQVAAGARLQVKTTQLETRLQTYINVGRTCDGMLPMPLNYCGAFVTWRMSGGMSMNVQNMPRIDPKQYKTSDALRKSLRAPKGKKVVVCDSSNIELRVAHTLAGQHDTIEKLHNKEDLYCWFASGLYGRTITKADELERFIGKVAMLSLQYGSSWRTFQNMARVLSKGVVLLSDDECQTIVARWREMFPAIAGKGHGIWARCDEAIKAMASGRRFDIDAGGLCVTDKEIIHTPAGHWLQYPSLHQERGKNGYMEWVYGQGKNRSRLYGAHLFENIAQHLARLIVMEQTLAASRKYPVALSCHDEAVSVVDEDEAEDCKAFVLQCMTTPPVWWPDIPLAAEAGIGDTYGAAKH
jgi:hypothetical protein